MPLSVGNVARTPVEPATAALVVGASSAVLLARALRLPFVAEPAYPDEGGYLLAARQWAAGTRDPPAAWAAVSAAGCTATCGSIGRRC